MREDPPLNSFKLFLAIIVFFVVVWRLVALSILPATQGIPMHYRARAVEKRLIRF